MVASPLLRASPLFSALADANRLAILDRLRRGECCVGDLCAELDMPQSLMSFHLKTLRDSGLVFGRRVGRTILYALDGAGIMRLERLIGALRNVEDPADDPILAAELAICQEYINVR
jgi:ArsR family transcriptional regulator, arsenate/arsenite/antimonite-responsive transcriptional repressor